MQFRIADTFTSSLTKLTSDEQKSVKTTAFDLQMNPANPGMQFHKLDRAKDKNFWSVRVNRDIRIIVHKTEASLLLCYVDHHDPAYDWALRRKLETHPTTGAAQLVEIRETVKDVVVPNYVVLDELKTKMTAAAAACQFERATVLRDHLANLQWLSRRLNDLKKSQTLLSGVLPIAARNRKQAWLLLREGRLIGIALRPDEPARASKAIEALTHIADTKSHLPETILEMNLQLIIMAWFRRHPHQRNDLISFDAALDFCRKRCG